MALNTHAAHAQANDHEPHVHGGPKLYAAVLAALLFLTVVTVGASMIDFGGGMANVVIAMLIASLKASLVALFFMHLRWEGRMNAIIFCSTLFFLGLFLIGCYTDSVARPALEPTNLKAPAPTAPAPGATPPAGGAPAMPGAAPQGSTGGAAAGAAPKPATTH